ncbi:ABC transporter substrate-binding protein [Ruicaihuangia caeni]|uniref:ABC transporter substrate-binding protein n=1 Tax=Ruicaihuangia caeni TaxID=3042517 RepID=A0AAW6T6H3_9MICO|nr:ABC transporter substrate-binding protein [Klugiella sp. YN-L-19]MDI2098671.1 ABC transporter substrate-binding protein [Klugiella sp. YN-L-19]
MTFRPSRKRAGLAILAGPAALALMVTGCSSANEPDPQSTSGSGTLVAAITADPDTLFPWKATQFQAVNVLENIYGTLTQFDDELNVVPGLAEKWEPSEDGTQVTLTLRDGVTFHDGSEFDADDVKHSLDLIRDEATAAVAAASIGSVTDVEVVDPLTVTLTLSAPDAGLMANLANVNVAMLSSDDTEEDLNTEPNGTGAFVYVDRTPNQSIKLEANEDYWGDAASLSSLEFRIIADETSIVSALQSGDVQFAVLNDPLVAKTAEGSGISVVGTPQLSYHALQLNATKGALTDVNVRLAMQCAIDRQQVLDTAALGEGEVTGPITSPAFKSDPEARPCPERDLDKAKEYLAKAGMADGVTVKTIVSQGSYATSVNEAQNLQAQLAEAGITLDLEVLEAGAYVDRWIAADFEAAVALNGGRPDPDGMYGRYFPSTGNLNQVAGYNSPELDALFAEGKATMDADERKSIYDEISQHLEDNAAWIWLFTSYTYTATTDTVDGFTPMANGSLQNLRSTTVSN